MGGRRGAFPFVGTVSPDRGHGAPDRHRRSPRPAGFRSWGRSVAAVEAWPSRGRPVHRWRPRLRRPVSSCSRTWAPSTRATIRSRTRRSRPALRTSAERARQRPDCGGGAAWAVRQRSDPLPLPVPHELLDNPLQARPDRLALMGGPRGHREACGSVTGVGLRRSECRLELGQQRRAVPGRRRHDPADGQQRLGRVLRVAELEGRSVSGGRDALEGLL